MVVLPFLCVTYLLMFLDKVLLNYAAAMGIKKNLKGNESSNLGTIFWRWLYFHGTYRHIFYSKVSSIKSPGLFYYDLGYAI